MASFSNEQDWFTASWALIVWAAHFMLLWTASSVFPGDPAARWLALLLTLAAGGALAWLYLRAGRPSLLSAAGLGLGVATLGTIFDAVPALIG